MSPDFRYHIASLAAVFLALGIGILIGTAFVGAPIVDRQTTLIRRLEGSVTALRAEAAETQKSEESLRALLPGAVQGKLVRRRVLVMQCGDYADAADQTAEALRLAGATVARVRLPAEAWREPASPDAEASNPALTGEDAIKEAARRLAPLLAAGGDTSALNGYRERGLLAGEELPAGAGAFRYVVLVGGGRGTSAGPLTGGENSPETPWPTTLARSRDLPLTAELTDLGVTVVGVEPVDAEISFMSMYQGAVGMAATVDCIDRAAGKIGLVFALIGEGANYGMKPTADRIVPPSLLTAAEEQSAPEAVLPTPRASPVP